MDIKNYWRLAIYFVLMCYLLFMPANQMPSVPFIRIPHFDKMVHFGMFFILCILLFRPIKQYTPNFYFWTPLVTLLIAVTLEYLQQKVTASRHSDVYDLFANVAGLICATIFYRIFVNGKKIEVLF